MLQTHLMIVCNRNQRAWLHPWTSYKWLAETCSVMIHVWWSALATSAYGQKCSQIWPPLIQTSADLQGTAASFGDMHISLQIWFCPLYRILVVFRVLFYFHNSWHWVKWWPCFISWYDSIKPKWKANIALESETRAWLSVGGHCSATSGICIRGKWAGLLVVQNCGLCSRDDEKVERNLLLLSLQFRDCPLCIHIYTHTYIYTCTHTHTPYTIYIYIYIYVYIYIYIYIYIS